MGEMTLVQDEEFTESCGRFARLPDHVIFAHCSFEGFEISRPGLLAAIHGCGFTRMSWYWGLFNTMLISGSTFEDCVFKGCSFRGVDFVDCTFTRRRFELDNLGGACLFDGCRLVECVFENCVFMKDERSGAGPIFTKNRFYGCRQRGTEGKKPSFG